VEALFQGDGQALVKEEEEEEEKYIYIDICIHR